MKIKTSNMIEKLIENENFHLTGSRYYIPENQLPEWKTDWDFVTEYSDERVLRLLQLGFTEFKNGDTRNLSEHQNEFDVSEQGLNHSAANSLVQNIITYPSGDTLKVLFYDGDMINIILKRDVHVYLDVFNNVGRQFYERFLWKKNNKCENISEILDLLHRQESIRKYRHDNIPLDTELELLWNKLILIV